MTQGFRILNGHRRADRDLVAAFAAIPVAIISDNMFRMFSGGAHLRPFHKGGGLAGTALTVKTRPGDNLMIHKAVDIAEPGDVIVIDGGGELTNSLIGEIIVSHAISRGIAGFVVHGAIRDLDYISNSSFPVFASGVTHRGPYKDGPGEVNVPISLDGMIVCPGDIIVGDGDGVLCVGPDGAPTLLEAALAQHQKEKDILTAIAGPGWDRNWVDDILKSKGCEGV